MISTEHKIVEVYDLRADNRFEIKDKDIFQFCDRGQYILNSELNTIEFTCDSITVEIAGHPIKLPSGAKKRMWKIEKIIEDSFQCKVYDEGMTSIVELKTGDSMPVHLDHGSAANESVGLKTGAGHPTRDISSVLYYNDEQLRRLHSLYKGAYSWDANPRQYLPCIHPFLLILWQYLSQSYCAESKFFPPLYLNVRNNYKLFLGPASLCLVTGSGRFLCQKLIDIQYLDCRLLLLLFQ
jgi:hypothetical protein